MNLCMVYLEMNINQGRLINKMAYPNLIDKHLEEALFHPQDYICYKKVNQADFPKSYIILYDRKLFSRVKRKYDLKPEPQITKVLGNIRAYSYNGIGLIKLNGIGSPHAIVVLEELIALGGKNFINIGTAGGLLEEGIFLCDRAIRDEGTSSHYLAHEKYSYPNSQLTESFGKSLTKAGLKFRKATTWTIDAPYRETKKEIEQYRGEGVATVEMEASALFAVAKLRKVRIASAFAVSDVLGKKWEPKFHHLNLKTGLNQLVEAALYCLKHA